MHFGLVDGHPRAVLDDRERIITSLARCSAYSDRSVYAIADRLNLARSSVYREMQRLVQEGVVIKHNEERQRNGHTEVIQHCHLTPEGMELAHRIGRCRL